MSDRIKIPKWKDQEKRPERDIRRFNQDFKRCGYCGYTGYGRNITRCVSM